jgi:hypothetical protein
VYFKSLRSIRCTRCKNGNCVQGKHDLGSLSPIPVTRYDETVSILAAKSFGAKRGSSGL